MQQSAVIFIAGTTYGPQREPRKRGELVNPLPILPIDNNSHDGLCGPCLKHQPTLGTHGGGSGLQAVQSLAAFYFSYILRRRLAVELKLEC